jgi:hypothetical protein
MSSFNLHSTRMSMAYRRRLDWRLGRCCWRVWKTLSFEAAAVITNCQSHLMINKVQPVSYFSEKALAAPPPPVSVVSVEELVVSDPATASGIPGPTAASAGVMDNSGDNGGCTTLSDCPV